MGQRLFLVPPSLRPPFRKTRGLRRGDGLACETGLGALGQGAFPKSRGGARKGSSSNPKHVLRIIGVSQSLNTCPEGLETVLLRNASGDARDLSKEAPTQPPGQPPRTGLLLRACALGEPRESSRTESKPGAATSQPADPWSFWGKLCTSPPTPRLGSSHRKKQTLCEAWAAAPLPLGLSFPFFPPPDPLLFGAMVSFAAYSCKSLLSLARLLGQELVRRKWALRPAQGHLPEPRIKAAPVFFPYSTFLPGRDDQQVCRVLITGKGHILVSPEAPPPEIPAPEPATPPGLPEVTR